MVSKLITQTAVWIAAMAAVLFVAAGTVCWPAAWVFLAEMAGLGLAIGLWLARRDPALLAERLTAGFQAAQKTWDKVAHGHGVRAVDELARADGARRRFASAGRGCRYGRKGSARS